MLKRKVIDQVVVKLVLQIRGEGRIKVVGIITF